MTIRFAGVFFPKIRIRATLLLDRRIDAQRRAKDGGQAKRNIYALDQ
jgi:hypothetical protein